MSNFNGTLLSVSSDKSTWTNIPLSYMRASSYKVTKNVMDLDSTRNANGVLVRTALDHYAMKVEFNIPSMTDKKIGKLMKIFRDNYSNETERKLFCKMYVPEMDDYVIQECYMPDIEFSIYGIFNGIIQYNEVRVAFIGY